jgi:hypothetical protein
MFSFFNLRATLLLPLAHTPDSAPSAAAIQNIAGGYIDQAVALPGCLKAMDDMIEAFAETAQCSDASTVLDNAARVTISRGFLLGLLVGNQPAHMTQLLESHAKATPTISALHGPTLASMLLAGPQTAALAASLMGQPAAPPPPQYTPAALPPVPDKPPPARAPQARILDSQTVTRGTPSGFHGPLFDHPSRPGFRTDAGGLLYHMSWYCGEYSTPPGWVPPPGALSSWPGGPLPPTPPLGKTGTASQLNIPVAPPIVGASSPFSVATTQPCLVCHRPGHAQYECPKRFFDTYGIPLPGHLPSGDQDPSAWLGGNLHPAARAAMVQYLSERGVTPHRKYGVTLAHLAAGTAPALRQ